MTQAKTLLLAGASGLVGRHLIDWAGRAGWQVRALTRHPEVIRGQAGVEWRPWRLDDSAETLAALLDGVDAIVNLAGVSIADGRLDAPHRERVLASRVDSVKALARGWRAAAKPPSVLFQISAVGFYGDTGDREVDEQQPAGKLFLSQVCTAWEGALSAFGSDGPRLVIGRAGMVLAEDAPAWEKFVNPIRFGLGGAFGSGQQWWSWIDADDLAQAILGLLDDPNATGVHNLCSPEPVRQLELCRAVGKRLSRPVLARMPAIALRALAGKVADELLLASCRAVPKRLLERGFHFERPSVQSALDKYLLPL